jgi:hypothetical protein
VQSSGTPLLACLLIGSAFGQTAEDVLRSKLTSARYTPLAEMARIEGDVHLVVNNGVITAISSHPLLTSIAIGSAKGFESVQTKSKLDLTYHFVLVNTVTSVPTATTVKKGNAFTRAILRVFGAKTEKLVHGYRCEEGLAPVNDVKVNGTAAEVWIYGRSHCLQTNTAALVWGLAVLRRSGVSVSDIPTLRPRSTGDDGGLWVHVVASGLRKFIRRGRPGSGSYFAPLLTTSIPRSRISSLPSATPFLVRAAGTVGRMPTP